MEKQLEGLESLSINVDELYKEESITDRKAASIRRLIPIKKDGSEDPTRETIYIGDTTLMTQMGPIPVQFPLRLALLRPHSNFFLMASKRLWKNSTIGQRKWLGKRLLE